MKKLWLLLLLLLPITSQATYLAFDPDMHVGLGLRFPSQKDTPFVRPNLVAKTYLFTFAEDEFFSYLLGLKFAGLGGQIDTSGQLRPVISPVCAYITNMCVGPDLIFNQIDKVDFGVSFTLRF